MGGRKARLLFMGQALVFQHVHALVAAGFHPLVVAHPDDRVGIERESKVVVSSKHDQAGSLAVGVQALPHNVKLVLITPVDALPPRPETFQAIVAALKPGVLAVTPTYQGKRGHPVLVRRSVLDVYEQGHPPLREVLAALGPKRILVETDDPNVLSDLDDAERVVEATGALPRFG